MTAIGPRRGRGAAATIADLRTKLAQSQEEAKAHQRELRILEQHVEHLIEQRDFLLRWNQQLQAQEPA